MKKLFKPFSRRHHVSHGNEQPVLILNPLRAVVACSEPSLSTSHSIDTTSRRSLTSESSFSSQSSSPSLSPSSTSPRNSSLAHLAPRSSSDLRHPPAFSPSSSSTSFPSTSLQRVSPRPLQPPKRHTELQTIAARSSSGPSAFHFDFELYPRTPPRPEDQNVDKKNQIFNPTPNNNPNHLKRHHNKDDNIQSINQSQIFINNNNNIIHSNNNDDLKNNIYHLELPNKRHSCGPSLPSPRERLLIDRGDNTESLLQLYPPNPSNSPHVSYLRIKGGTAYALVTSLVEMLVFDHCFLDTFLATYRKFMTFEFLIASLKSRFFFTPSALSSPQQIATDLRWAPQIRSRILSVLELWFPLYGYDDIEANRAVRLPLLVSFLQQISNSGHSKFDLLTRASHLLSNCSCFSVEGVVPPGGVVQIRPSMHSLHKLALHLLVDWDDFSLPLLVIAKKIMAFKECGTWEASEWLAALIDSKYLIFFNDHKYILDCERKIPPTLTQYVQLFTLSPQAFCDILTQVC